MKAMNNKREHFETLAEQKREKIIKKLEELNDNKDKTFDQIEKYFEELIQKARQRCRELKQQYEMIEMKERLRLEQINEKINNDIEALKTFSQQF